MRFNSILRNLPALAFLIVTPNVIPAQAPAPTCTQCATWSVPQTPFKIFGNTYYVGTHGLSSILIQTNAGLVLIDGALPQSPLQIAESIKTLGFKLTDIKLILNTHAHYDHAGGIAELQRMTGANVVASKWSAAIFSKGGVPTDDPQYGTLLPIAPIAHVRALKDGEVLHLGKLTLTPHSTPGHTPGGTSWTWQSCEGARCLNMVYMDSVSAVSADGYKYTQRKTPIDMQDFKQSFAFLDTVSCDILITPHPEASNLWDRLDKRKAGDANAMIDTTACHTLAATGRTNLQKRVDTETGK